ncbi:autotransporter [Pantoea sp. RIT-PI-b]|uniref:autotransporter n=1 Tax=Pantoea sp. RIT-PI-b TaxID=1681195 RepID=UPI0006764666|nr:autotransporter [Pantoea sp. RIT-PI-b]KNC10461.1 autotransporter [Pantoea sp. RIT-PI-b]
MLQKSQRTGQHKIALAFGGLWLFFLAGNAYAFDQSGQNSAPDYNAILAEKISSNHLMLTENADANLFDAALNSPNDNAIVMHSESASVGAAPFVNRYSAGWSMPMSAAVSTGPVAQFAVDDSTLSCPKCERVDSNNAEHIASLGWRVDSSLGWISPWAQVSYSHLVNEEFPSPSREHAEDINGRDNKWVDVSVGANLPLGQNMAAFASFAQTGAVSNGEQFIYSLGVSASF